MRCDWRTSAEPCFAATALNRQLLDRSKLEVVISHANEDLSWSDPYDAIRTVYTRPSTRDKAASSAPAASHVVEIPNVGKEQYACACAFRTHVRGRAAPPLA